jgi:hypothetical protein
MASKRRGPKFTEQQWAKWLKRLQSYAMSEAEHTVDVTADFWRECFEDGMSPEIAFRESFVEQDGI